MPCFHLKQRHWTPPIPPTILNILITTILIGLIPKNWMKKIFARLMSEILQSDQILLLLMIHRICNLLLY